jgi:predicted DNA-binding protein (UPF0251 family)
MSQPRKPRICREFNGRRVFVPCGIGRDDMEFLHLGLDEFEALRLCDMEGLTQEEAGTRMGVSRGTVQRLLTRGRQTLIQSLVQSRALVLGRDRDPRAAAEYLPDTVAVSRPTPLPGPRSGASRNPSPVETAR